MFYSSSLLRSGGGVDVRFLEEHPSPSILNPHLSQDWRQGSWGLRTSHHHLSFLVRSSHLPIYSLIIAGPLSGAEFLRGAQQYPFLPPDPRSHRTESTSDNPIVVQMTGNPAAHVYPIGKVSSFPLRRGALKISQHTLPFCCSSRPEDEPRHHHALGT